MNRYQLRNTILFAIIIALLSGAIFTLDAQASSAAAEPPPQPPAPPLLVAYYGPDVAMGHSGVRGALALAGDSFTTEDLTPSNGLSAVDVFVLNGVIPDVKGISARVRSGAGLLLILGPDLRVEQVEVLLGLSLSVQPASDALSLAPHPAADDSVTKDVLWTGAPQVRERLSVAPDPTLTLQPLVMGYEDGSVVLAKIQLGQGTVYLLSPFLNGHNPQFQDWAYFNYLIYHLVSSAGGQTPLSFADYPASPVPHAAERNLLLLVMVGLVGLSFLAFFLMRRYSLAHPEALDALVTDRAQFRVRESKTQWEEVGFHRPLGGFMLALMLGLVMFIPLIVYQNLILPVYILPSAQALGIWGRVVQFFNLAWQFFDMGTSVAFIKFLSQYRVHDPRKGIQYGQVFVWWQALSGAIQVGLIIALASTLAPRSAYAIYSWSVILHAFIQVPGFYQVFRHALTGLQRFDYAQILDMSGAVLLLIAVQPVVVLAMYAWGKTQPVFGPSMAGLLGMGVAGYLMELGTFFIGFWLYRRLGLSARLLFMAHFDWEVVRNSFKFGVYEMLGSIAWAAGQAAEIWITQARLINYAEIWGNWGLAQNFIYAFQVMQTLLNNLMPSISEAISHGRVALSQYYSVMAYKYGGLISAFIGAVLLAVADRFIIGASGYEFRRAATYAVPLIIWGAIQYPSWVGDNVQLASNKPYLKARLIAYEQVIRVVLALILMPSLQIYALIVSYFVGLLSKDIIAYFVNNRLCFPQRFYAWQSLVAPLLAGGSHFLILRWLTGLIWQPDQVSSVIIFFLGILPSFPLFAFLYGFFGGWDDGGLEELRLAADLSNFMRPLSWLFWAASRLGARVSPLHNRFPIDIRGAALAEARSLTDERVRLDAPAPEGA